MKTSVRCYSRGGKTKKLAEAIAKEAGVEARDCSVAIDEPVDVLFLGGAVYWGGIDKNLKQFIAQLDPSKVKCVAVFGTSGIKKEPDREIEKLVQKKGIPVSPHSFHCRGEFSGIHKGHPDGEDLKQAAVFVRDVLAE